MKKTISLVAVLLILCVGFAAISEAVTTANVSGENILKTVEAGEGLVDYFATSAVKSASQGWGDAVAPDVENVEVSGERFLKITLDNQNFNFRLSYSSNPDISATANIVGYGYVRIRVILENAMTLALGIDDGNTAAMLDRFWLVTKDGELIGTASSYNGIAAPAGFDGYLYASLTHFTFQGGAQGSRDKDDDGLCVNPNNNAVAINPTAVMRGNQVWSGSGAIYFGEQALVDAEFAETSVHTAPANINFVLGDSFDAITEANITANYTGAADPSVVTMEILTNGSNKEISYSTGTNSILKLATNGFNAYTLNGNTQPWAFAFYVRHEGAENASINHMIAPEAVNHALYAGGHSYLYDMTGHLVAENPAGPGLTIPADFEGYYALQRTDGDYNVSASQLLVWITGALTIDDFGYLAAEPTAPALVDIIGVQESAVSNGTFDVRIVAGIDDLLFRNLSFVYNAEENGTQHWVVDQEEDITEAYTTIQIAGIDDATAAGYGVSYLTALTIQDVPAVGTIEFSVYMRYARESDPATSLTTVTYVITYVDGVFQSMAVA